MPDDQLGQRIPRSAGRSVCEKRLQELHVIRAKSVSDEERVQRRDASEFCGDALEQVLVCQEIGEQRMQERGAQQDLDRADRRRPNLVETGGGLVDLIVALSGKGLARYRLTSAARFQSLPIGTVRADFPHTARPVSFI